MNYIDERLKNEHNNCNRNSLGLYRNNRRAKGMRLAGICMFILSLLACLFFGFSFLPKNAFNDGTTITAYADAASDWQTAVTESLSSGETRTVKLTSDFTAVSGSFGADTTTFINGALYVPAGAKIVLDLNNCAVNRGLGTTVRASGYVIYVAGSLTIKDSTVTNGTYSTNGKITGGANSTGSSAGGIYIATGGNVTLESGRIINNRASGSTSGAGVYIGSGALFNMTGGAIESNVAVNNSNGTGGVYIYNSGVFNMTGGAVRANQATRASNYSYGGVFVANAAGTEFNMTGGSIERNSGFTAGGLHIAGINGKVSIGGTAQIYNGNTANGQANNVNFLNANSVINIVSPFQSGAKIAVTRTNGLITSGYSTHNAGVPFSTYFSVDQASNYFLYEEGEGASAEVFCSSVNNATNWDYFIARSMNTGTVQTIKLYSNWTAARSTTGFGVSYNSGGGLNVPAGAKIILDLNGYNLDRNYTSAASSGYVMYVAGQITIRDSKAGNSRITGGFNSTSSSAGGIYVSGGELTLESGHIYGNKVSNSISAGAVYINSSATFNMKGGYIENNASTNAGPGGVWVNGQAASRFIMTGGKIQNNTTTSATNPGGVQVNSSGVMRLGGNAVIENNTSAGTQKNVTTLDNNAKFEIVETIGSDFRVGLSKTNNNYENTSGLIFTTNWYQYANGASPIGKFFSDDSMYDVVSAGGIAQREAAMWCIDGAKNWQEANLKSSADGVQRTVKLYKDWVATAHSS